MNEPRRRLYGWMQVLVLGVFLLSLGVHYAAEAACVAPVSAAIQCAPGNEIPDARTHEGKHSVLHSEFLLPELVSISSAIMLCLALIRLTPIGFLRVILPLTPPPVAHSLI